MANLSEAIESGLVRAIMAAVVTVVFGFGDASAENSKSVPTRDSSSSRMASRAQISSAKRPLSDSLRTSRVNCSFTDARLGPSYEHVLPSKVT